MSKEPGTGHPVERIAKGEGRAIHDLLVTVAPGWAHVSRDDVQIEPLTGGYSGAVLFKVTAAGAEPTSVVVRVSGAGDATPMSDLVFASTDHRMPAAALRAWSRGANHEDVYCLEDPRFPRVSVTEYIAGRAGDADLMNGKDAVAYSRAMGEAVAWMHTRNADWFFEGIGRDEEATALAAIGSKALRDQIAALGNYERFGKTSSTRW